MAHYRERWEGNHAGKSWSEFRAEIQTFEMAAWVHGLAPWQVILHGTWKWEVSIWAAQRAVDRFHRSHLANCSMFYALEANPGRPGYHVHALVADCREVYWKDVWELWFERYGRFKSEAVRSLEDVTGYCSKYVTKEGAWWDVKLAWWRMRKRLNDFRLGC